MSPQVVETTPKREAPRLVRKGRAARPLACWIEVGHAEDSPMFHSVSKSGRIRKRRLNPDAIDQIDKH
ncbi:hypothetical protein [Ruegeria atlantica]|uniref:hypothetical protein n=1 Tax=Ruegeria atlantica TaxID=81569 RepID=UPI002494588A|nr:hypothetical protein [Ruegeria atlantica]